MTLWALGLVPLLIWFYLCTIRYRAARGKSFLERGDRESFSATFRRQADSHLESLRRRVWVATGLWFAYMVFGARFWAALVGQ
jgi:hypothetical protein